MRQAAADSEGQEMLPASWAVGLRRELGARWALVQVVAAALVARHGIHLSAQSERHGMAVAVERLEPLVAKGTGYAASPSQSKLVKSVMVLA